MSNTDLQAQTPSAPQTSVAIGPTSDSHSSPLRWLVGCPDLFKPQRTDSKDVLCMIEVLQDRVVRMDVVLSELESVLVQQVQEFISNQAQYCESLFCGDAELLASIRQADQVNERLIQQLDSSQSMSRALFQRITGIIEAPAPQRPATAAPNAPSR